MRISDWSSDVCSFRSLRDDMDKSSRGLDLNGPALPAPGGLDIGLTQLVVIHVPPPLLQFGLLKGGVGVQAVTHPLLERRSEGRRGGTECVSTFRCRWSP